MPNPNKAFNEKRKRLIAEGKQQDAKQMKKTNIAARKALKEMERERKRKIKEAHKVSGYRKKRVVRVVNGETISKN